MAGWACDPETGAPVSRVEVRIDGVRIGNATLGGERPDVAAVLGSQCLLSGWSYSGSIGILATGMHTVSVVAVDPSNNPAELGGTISIEVVPAPTPGWKGYIYFAGQMLAQYSDGTTYFAHKDHLGSTRVLTKVDKSVHDSMDYLPFGEQIAGGSGTTRKFTGHERDSESGLDYMKARYYSSSTGRFTSPDPLLNSGRPWNPQTWNRYAYTLNNPIAYVDPTGLWEWSEVLGGSAKDDDLKKQQKAAKKKKDKAEVDRLKTILERRKQFRNALEQAKRAANNLGGAEGAAVRAAVAQYGKEHEGGPKVGVNSNSDAAPGTTFVRDDQAHVSFSESAFGSGTFFATVAHEGEHVRHANIWMAHGLDTLDYNISVYGTEFSSYMVATWAVKGSGRFSSYSADGVELWNASWAAADSNAKMARGVNSLLDAQDRGSNSARGSDIAWPGRRVPN